jgi:hypothetical protein
MEKESIKKTAFEIFSSDYLLLRGQRERKD